MRPLPSIMIGSTCFSLLKIQMEIGAKQAGDCKDILQIWRDEEERREQLPVGILSLRASVDQTFPPHLWCALVR